MPSPKLTAEQKRYLSSVLQEIEAQSTAVQEHIDFIRDNTGLPRFVSDVATPVELLRLVRACKAELVELAEYQVPIYLGRCLLEEFNGYWSVEERPSMAMFGRPYVDGFGNIGYENIYLPMLHIRNEDDVRRFERFRAGCRRAFDLRAKFHATFSHLAGSSILRSY